MDDLILLTCFSLVLQLYRNQSIDLHNKSTYWFLYNHNTGLKLVNQII